MRILALQTQLSSDQLRQAYLKAADKRTAQRYQAIYLRKQGMMPPQIAKVVGRHQETVRKWVKRFNQGGLEALRYRPPQAGPARRLPEKHWVEIDQWLEEPPPDGSARWTRAKLQAQIQARLGIHLSVNRIGELLHERGYRRLRPRPQHHQRDEQAAKAFKKSWQKSTRRQPPKGVK